LCCSGFFVYVTGVKLKPLKRVPVLIAFGVILLVGLLRWGRFDLFDRLERMTFDLRVRAALHFPAGGATNLGFVFVNEESVKRVWNGSLGYRFGLFWPRQVYGALLRELAEQEARGVALDVVFGELRPEHARVQMADSQPGPESDDFFAAEMRRAGNVILALSLDVTPPNLFLTNAPALGDISADKDSDGILRRARAFRVYRRWHDAFRQMADDPEFAVDLNQARLEPNQIVLPRPAELGDIKIPLAPDGTFDLADFGGDKLPAGAASRAKPFVEERVWHMGVALAARELQLDLDRAELDLPHGRITLHSPAGLERVIPVDADGYCYIDWSLPVGDPRVAQESIHDLLAQYRLRLQGRTNDLVNRWRGKLAVVGSSAVVGNNMTDRGATPLSPDTLLVSKHWNVANSVLTGRFVHRAPLGVELGLVVILGILAAFLTWQPRVLLGSGLVLALILAYMVLAVAVYVQTRYWLPIFFPVAGACLMTHVCLVTWRTVFEEAGRRRVKAVLSTIVSPKIAHVLLQAEKLALGGARREITVLFADVRGFTEFTDASQEQVAEFVRRNGLTGPAAEACFDEQARETLATINLYLGVVADTILEHDGALDKFIGDCVMAFWGAPNPDPRHAVACVRAAIEAQRAVYELNHRRAADNRQREAENQTRLTTGLEPRPPLPILFLGTGINTGMATVGMMGSEVKTVVRQGNYTVFGREVNLASRLEGKSGRGRIFIGETTYQHLVRDDPALAALCTALPNQALKGIATPVTIYEVPWRPPGAPPLEAEFATPNIPDTTAFTARLHTESIAKKKVSP
jgi:class 3 adenylate cyclase/CHASE2 domain-containing sensor protein